jgi:hypothetical protein
MKGALMGWKVRRASKAYDSHPKIRYGTRATEDDRQITTLTLPMSVLVVDIQDPDSGLPAFMTLNLSQEAGYGFILARPDQEEQTAYVVRSIEPLAQKLPLAWLPLEDFGDLWRWKERLKTGVGVAPMPKTLPPISGFYRNLRLPGPRWVFGSWEDTIVGSSKESPA